MTFEELKKIFPNATPETWHQHPNGKGWVENTASVAASAFVEPDARVYGNASVYDYAQVCDNAQVYGHAQVFGFAQVRWHARVYNCAKVYGDAQVCGESRVFGNALVYDHARVYDKARVHDNARIYGSAWIYGNALVFGNARIYDRSLVLGGTWAYGNADVHGDTTIRVGHITQHEWTKSPIVIFGSRYEIGHSSPDGLNLRSGCIDKPLSWWDENVERCAEEHGYTPEQQQEYRTYVETFKSLIRRKEMQKPSDQKSLVS